MDIVYKVKKNEFSAVPDSILNKNAASDLRVTPHTSGRGRACIPYWSVTGVHPLFPSSHVIWARYVKLRENENYGGVFVY